MLILFLLLGSLLVVEHADAQLFCTPLGTSTVCSGWDATMTDRALVITPLVGGSSMITDYTPRRYEPIPDTPIPYTPRSRFADSIINDRRSSTSMRESLLQERRAPWALPDPDELDEDGLPPPPFPE